MIGGGGHLNVQASYGSESEAVSNSFLDFGLMMLGETTSHAVPEAGITLKAALLLPECPHDWHSLPSQEFSQDFHVLHVCTVSVHVFKFTCGCTHVCVNVEA